MSDLASFVRPIHAALAALALAACSGASSDQAVAAEGDAPAHAAQELKTGALADMTLGDPDAPVTVIEYASVTCPHCAHFYEDVFPALKEKYIDTGKVKFVFREFPTSPANLSVAGSMIARCAADKGGTDAYFTVVDTLFTTQKTWIFGEDPRDELVKIAAKGGLSEADFDACVHREEVLNKINENVESGRNKYGVNSTPSFIVNETLRHFSTIEEFSDALDDAIKKSEEQHDDE